MFVSDIARTAIFFLALFLALDVQAQSDAQQLFFDGFELFKNGNAKDASKKFEEGLKIESGNATAHFYLGESFLQLKAYSKASAQYEQTIKLSPAGDISRKAKERLASMPKGGEDESADQGTRSFVPVLTVESEDKVGLTGLIWLAESQRSGDFLERLRADAQLQIHGSVTQTDSDSKYFWKVGGARLTCGRSTFRRSVYCPHCGDNRTPPRNPDWKMDEEITFGLSSLTSIGYSVLGDYAQLSLNSADDPAAFTIVRTQHETEVKTEHSSGMEFYVPQDSVHEMAHILMRAVLSCDNSKRWYWMQFGDRRPKIEQWFRKYVN